MDVGETIARDDSPGGKYRAPALEKGLDVLELLVAEARPLTMSEICTRLGRSQGEIFRMVQVLQSRGFLSQEDSSDGYYVTDRLFSMAMRQPQTLGLLELSLPSMRKLSVDVGQSCHLVVHSRGEMVVVARMESDGLEGFSVRIGRRAPIEKSASGVVLFAFQPDDIRKRWLSFLPASTERGAIAALVAEADTVAAQGFICKPSINVDGVTDLSAPILRGGRAAAALSIPYIKQKLNPLSREQTVEGLIAAAEQISNNLYEADNRV